MSFIYTYFLQLYTNVCLRSSLKYLFLKDRYFFSEMSESEHWYSGGTPVAQECQNFAVLFSATVTH